MRFSAVTAADRMLPAKAAALLRPLFSRVDQLLSPADEAAVAKRMSLIAFGIRIISAVIALVSQVLLARWMGSFEYGIFVLVWVSMIIAGNLSCLGFHTSIIRYIPEYLEKKLFAELRGIILASRLFSLAVSTAIALAGLAFIRFNAGSIEPFYVVPFYLGMFCLPMIALSDVLQGMSRAHSWPFSALAPIYLVRPILILLLMVMAIGTGYDASAETAVTCALVATYATTIGQLVFVTNAVDRRIPSGPRKVLFNQWLAVSLPIFLVEGFFFLLTNADVLMVGFFMTPHDVAIYFATVKILALVHFVYFAVKAGVAQRYAQFAHSGDDEKLAAFARQTVAWTFWPSLLMAAFVLLFGQFLLQLFGSDFTAGYPLLFVLLAGIAARASVGPAESVLTMSGNQNACAKVYAATLAVNLILNFILIPIHGLWGAAIATGLAMLFEATTLSITVWRKLGFVMFIGTTLPVMRGEK